MERPYKFTVTIKVEINGDDRALAQEPLEQMIAFEGFAGITMASLVEPEVTIK